MAVRQILIVYYAVLMKEHSKRSMQSISFKHTELLNNNNGYNNRRV